MLRVWCLAVLVCLSLWGTVSGTPQDASAVLQATLPDVSVLDDASSRDDSSNRSWEAVRPAACPTGSSWTSQTHHAALARTLCHSLPRAAQPDVLIIPAPRALRAQFDTPLLI